MKRPSSPLLLHFCFSHRAGLARKRPCASPRLPISSLFFRPFSTDFSRPPEFTPKPLTRPRPCSPRRSRMARPLMFFSLPTSVFPQRLIDAGLAELGDGTAVHPSSTPKARSCCGTRKDSHLPAPSLDLLRTPLSNTWPSPTPTAPLTARAAVAALQNAEPLRVAQAASSSPPKISPRRRNSSIPETPTPASSR